jgi:molybdopterin synthase catalytic subunit
MIDKEVLSLEYEAYPEMALSEMQNVCNKVT